MGDSCLSANLGGVWSDKKKPGARSHLAEAILAQAILAQAYHVLAVGMSRAVMGCERKVLSFLNVLS